MTTPGPLAVKNGEVLTDTEALALYCKEISSKLNGIIEQGLLLEAALKDTQQSKTMFASIYESETGIPVCADRAA